MQLVCALSSSVLLFPRWVNECFFSANLHTQPVHFLSRLPLSPLYPAFLTSTFQTRLVLHAPISDSSANYTYYNITISFHHFQNVIVGELKKTKKNKKRKVLFQNYWLLFVA